MKVKLRDVSSEFTPFHSLRLISILHWSPQSIIIKKISRREMGLDVCDFCMRSRRELDLTIIHERTY